MSAKEDQQYQTWLAELESGLSDEQKTHLRALADAPLLKEEVFRGTLRRADYNRRVNELHQQQQGWESEKAEIQAWYAKNKPINDRLVNEKTQLEARAKALESKLHELGLEDEAAQVRQSAQGDGKTMKELEELRTTVTLFDRALPRLAAELAEVGMRSMSEGTQVSPRDVVDHSARRGITPLQAYEELTYEQRQAAYEADLKRKFDEAEKRGMEKGRAEAFSRSSSPDMIRDVSPIFSTDKDKVVTDRSARVQAAINDFATGAWKGTA